MVLATLHRELPGSFAEDPIERQHVQTWPPCAGQENLGFKIRAGGMPCYRDTCELKSSMCRRLRSACETMQCGGLHFAPQGTFQRSVSRSHAHAGALAVKYHASAHGNDQHHVPQISKHPHPSSAQSSRTPLPESRMTTSSSAPHDLLCKRPCAACRMTSRRSLLLRRCFCKGQTSMAGGSSF